MTRDSGELPSASHPSPRTSAEWDAFAAATHYARSHDLSTPAESAYLEALGDARSEITRRLVRGLIRGAPAGLPAPVIVSRESPTVPDEPAPLSGLNGQRLRSCIEPLPDCRSLALLPFPAAETTVVAPVAAIHGYDRFRFADPIRQWSPVCEDAAAAVDHPLDLVSLVEQEGVFVNAEQAATLRTEVAESVANLALAQLAASVQADAIDPGVGSVLAAVADGLPAADSPAAFERIVTDGHPFHPSGKIRLGMSPTEGLAYAPEFTDRIDLRFVAIRRDTALEVEATAGVRLTDRLYSTFDGLDDAVRSALPSGSSLADFAVVPVHPWQYHNTIAERYASQRADGRVVLVPNYTHPVTPQLNLRTVVPYDTERTDGPIPRLKLAIDVRTTNVVRTLSPHAVTNGPQITDVLSAIESRASFDRLGFLAEPAATCYCESGGPHLAGERFDDARNLSGLVRSNPATHPLADDDDRWPVVASSLVSDVPTTGRPLVCDLVEEYAETTGAVGEDAALGFVDEYAAVVVPEQLLLLTKYGVALESHLQNSLVVFDGPRPVGTLVRDFGGVRVHGERLGAHGLSFDPYPDSDVDADGEADLYRKLYYALFQNHLAELVATVCHELDVDEDACWARIREQCERTFVGIRADSAVPDGRVNRDERALFDDPIVHKALTAMRLQGKRHEYVTSQISNPLARQNR